MNNLLAEQIIQDMNKLLAESRWRKQKAVEEIGKLLKKISWKTESQWRNRIAVEEDFLGFLGNRKAIEENQILSKENWILGEGNLDIREGFHNFWRDYLVIQVEAT